MRRLLLLLSFLVLLPASGWAVQPDEILADPTLEARARSLSAELRCLVCQNQSIDDSAAPLARDLRLIVRERLTAGDSDAAVKSFLVARYGDFVLLKPPLNASTLLLWMTPALIFLAGGTAIVVARRRGRRRSEPRPLTAAEQARLDALTAPPSGQTT